MSDPFSPPAQDIKSVEFVRHPGYLGVSVIVDAVMTSLGLTVYPQQLNPGLPPRQLKQSVEESEGLFVTQLREVHVIAEQGTFERKGEIGEGDLLLAIHALRQSNLTASRDGAATGFLSREEVSA